MRAQDGAPDDVYEPTIELAVIPPRLVVTGVRSWPCPVCQCELPREQYVCPECGERMTDELAFMGSGHLPTPEAGLTTEGPSGFLVQAADILPMAVAKRLLVYPLLFAFFANLFVPCRFHSTGSCLLLASLGLLGVYANHKCGRST